MKVRFKTGVNSASPNANRHEEINAKRRTKEGENAVKRQMD